MWQRGLFEQRVHIHPHHYSKAYVQTTRLIVAGNTGYTAPLLPGPIKSICLTGRVKIKASGALLSSGLLRYKSPAELLC